MVKVRVRLADKEVNATAFAERYFVWPESPRAGDLLCFCDDSNCGFTVDEVERYIDSETGELTEVCVCCNNCDPDQVALAFAQHPLEWLFPSFEETVMVSLGQFAEGVRKALEMHGKYAALHHSQHSL